MRQAAVRAARRLPAAAARADPSPAAAARADPALHGGGACSSPLHGGSCTARADPVLCCAVPLSGLELDLALHGWPPGRVADWP
jgi:hypothetical protein